MVTVESPLYKIASLQYVSHPRHIDMILHIMLNSVRPVLALLPNAEYQAKEQSVPVLKSLRYDDQSGCGLNPQVSDLKVKALPSYPLLVKNFFNIYKCSCHGKCPKISYT